MIKLRFKYYKNQYRLMKNLTPLKILCIAIASFFVSCSDKTEDIPADVKINDFVWGGMNAYYLWQENVSDLADNRFSNREQLNSYLAGFDSPDNLFNQLLDYPSEYPKDPNRVFSWIVDDYIALEESFQGIRTTTGLKIVVANYNDGSQNVYAYVRDVAIGSSADANGVTRGMIISEVDGIQLTLANFRDLLTAESFTIGLADYNGGNPTANGTTINVTSSVVEENPVKIANVPYNDGVNKIGYLLFNQFSTSYDDELNAAFAYFKSEAITDLVIDLRYNGGGSVRTATYLGSMITGQFNEEVFSQQEWNSKVMNNSGGYDFKNYFTNEIDNGQVNEAINSLELSRIYFIVTDNSASASELVINALKAYIDVSLVGTQTYGKHVGSITLYDSDNYTKNGPNFDSSHTWAMQPIVLEIQNKNGENAPEGFIPDVEIVEDPSNLGVLGEADEPLLERTIQLIVNGSRISQSTSEKPNVRKVWNTNMSYPDNNNMYVELQR